MKATFVRLAAAGTLALLGSFGLPPDTHAQVDTGTILGVVTDSSGSVLPGATVTILHEGTSLSLTTVTREDGSYVFTPVRTGSYQIEVEFPGFKKTRRSIELKIQQQAAVDVAMSPGDVKETVEVRGGAPLLQTQSGSVGETVSAQTAVNLPLNGRDFTYLARLTAGVTHAQPGARAPGQFAANGARPAQNSYLLDGIDNNTSNVDFLSGVAFVVQPPVDAISEFKVLTNSFSAEYGRAGGAVLNASVKSGTNAFRGSAWEFYRNEKLDAADYFANATGQAKAKLRQNQYGGSGGGPVIKNKAFWFGTYEGTRSDQGRLWTTTVPTAAERSSGFTDLSDLIAGQSGTRGPDALGRAFALGTIFDPATTRSVIAGQMDPVTGRVATASGFVRDPFAGNRIPAGRLNSNAVKLLNLYPEPNLPGLFNNYVVTRLNETDTDALHGRVDYNLTGRHRLFGRYSITDSTRLRPGPFEGFADGGFFGEGIETVRTHGAAASYTHMFSSSLINEARVGISREHTNRIPPFADDTSDIPGQFGIQGIPQVAGNGGLPPINISGLHRLGAVTWLVSERFSNSTQFTNNLTKLYKSHVFKGGVELQHVDFPWTAPPFSRGDFSFNGAYTSMPLNGDGSTGRAQLLLSPISSLVPNGVDRLGGADFVQASPFGGVDNFKNYYAAYGQDDWRITRNLTVNLGLRWEHFSLVGEKNWAQSNFIPGPPGAGARYVIPARRRDDPVLSPGFVEALALDGIDLVYSDEFGSGLGRAQHNLAPRIGAAYQPHPRVVVRGGYGIYYGAFENRGGFPNLGYNYPFQFDFAFRPANDSSPVFYPDGSTATLERGLLGVPLDARFVSGAGLNLRAIEFDYKTPRLQSYNAMLQYELTPNDSLEIGYVGSRGSHIETFIGTNHVTQLLPPGVNPQLHVPFPQFARGSSYASTVGVSRYHSLQTKFTHRLSKGLEFLAAYTLSESTTNAGDLLSGGGAGGLRAPAIPGFGIERDIGLAAFHVKHAFVYSGTYELPFTGRFLGGWSTNWILTLYSGQPQTIGCTVATAAGVGCYALLVPGEDPYGGRHDVSQFYNPAVFANPPAATTIGQTDFSPLGGNRTQVTGPALRQLDFSVIKRIDFAAGTRMELRAEAFNLTNTPSFSLPGSLNFNDTLNFARITSTRNSARQVQLGVKFYW
jgi:outer membrane receptor protein involved in Fe transport